MYFVKFPDALRGKSEFFTEDSIGTRDSVLPKLKSSLCSLPFVKTTPSARPAVAPYHPCYPRNPWLNSFGCEGGDPPSPRLRRGSRPIGYFGAREATIF